MSEWVSGIWTNQRLAEEKSSRVCSMFQWSLSGTKSLFDSSVVCSPVFQGWTPSTHEHWAPLLYQKASLIADVPETAWTDGRPLHSSLPDTVHTRFHWTEPRLYRVSKNWWRIREKIFSIAWRQVGANYSLAHLIIFQLKITWNPISSFSIKLFNLFDLIWGHVLTKVWKYPHT